MTYGQTLSLSPSLLCRAFHFLTFSVFISSTLDFLAAMKLCGFDPRFLSFGVCVISCSAWLEHLTASSLSFDFLPTLCWIRNQGIWSSPRYYLSLVFSPHYFSKVLCSNSAYFSFTHLYFGFHSAFLHLS